MKSLNTLIRASLSLLTFSGILLPATFLSAAATDPWDELAFEPGVYREYSVIQRVRNHWRVTDPSAPREDAREHLPNQIFTLKNVDLNGAKRAQLTMHHWAGHSGTPGQQVLINSDHALDIPVNPFISQADPAKYLNDDNPVLEVPLEWLKNGGNTIQGTIDESVQGQHWWGQWGWYWTSLQLKIDPSIGSVPEGKLVVDVPGEVIEASQVAVRVDIPDGECVDEVRFYARYFGFDEDGDGIFHDWHGFEESLENTVGHLGTDRTEPFEVSWNLNWIPDQKPESVAFTAIIRKGNTYRVLEPVDGYSIRRDYSVKLFSASEFPHGLVRNNQTKTCVVEIPPEYPVDSATNARFLIRTWNGMNHTPEFTPVNINKNGCMERLIEGANHYFDIANKRIPPEYLRNGRNEIELFSTTAHHGCEVLVPGPVILVRWDATDSH